MKTVWLSVPLLVTLGGVLTFTPSRSSIPPKANALSVRTRNKLPLSPEMEERLDAHYRVGLAMEAGKFREAESLVDEHLDDPWLGESFSRSKAELLARRGERTEALDRYLSILRNPKRQWNPDSRGLALPLDLAVSLGREADADLIATRAIAHPTTRFFNDPGVQAPKAARTAKERLAYAYLAIGADVWQSDDPGFFVGYARKAQNLLPNSLPVRIQLGYALAKRRGPGDLDSARVLLRGVRAASGSPSTREEIDALASASGIDLSALETSASERGPSDAHSP